MAQTIKSIDEKLKGIAVDELAAALEQYTEDERTGVKKLIDKYNRKISKHQALIDKYEDMCIYENSYLGNDMDLIAGIDEAGRGPLAGPVVTAAVILDPNKPPILGLDDSKKLSAKRREELYERIVSEALAYEVGIGDVKAIDDINILQATYKAMAQAVNGLKLRPQQLLVDAVTIPGVSIPQQGIIEGDAKSVSIAAASIIAKVTRDRMMKDYAELFPEYDFTRNKGYGTSDHIQALKKHGACPIHRRSFLKNMDLG